MHKCWGGERFKIGEMSDDKLESCKKQRGLYWVMVFLGSLFIFQLSSYLLIADNMIPLTIVKHNLYLYAKAGEIPHYKFIGIEDSTWLKLSPRSKCMIMKLLKNHADLIYPGQTEDEMVDVNRQWLEWKVYKGLFFFRSNVTSTSIDTERYETKYIWIVCYWVRIDFL